jgi:TatA/E family protein of Tat protein translocase
LGTRGWRYPRLVPFNGAFSPLHWLIIAIVAFLVLGPKELPDLARKVGRGVREFKRIQQHLASELGDLVEQLDPSPTTMPPTEETPRAEPADAAPAPIREPPAGASVALSNASEQPSSENGRGDRSSPQRP